MKITKVESLKCPLCQSASVTRIEEVLLSCDACKQIIKYQPPKVTEADVEKVSDSQRGNANLALLWFMVVCAISAVYFVNKYFALDEAETAITEAIDDVTEDEPEQDVGIGSCIANKPIEACTEGAPDWETKDNRYIIQKVVDIGVKKVRVIWAVYDCNGERISDEYYLDAIDVDILGYYKKIECPADIEDVKLED